VAGALYDDVAGQVDQGSTLVFVLLEKPGRPRAESPVGRTSTRRPTFEWTRTTRASSFELRVYKGSRLILKKAGIPARTTSWRPASRLPRGVALTWKVRARNPAGYGGWSNAPRFSVR
jgi:hypothetical protein